MTSPKLNIQKFFCLLHFFVFHFKNIHFTATVARIAKILFYNYKNSFTVGGDIQHFGAVFKHVPHPIFLGSFQKLKVGVKWSVCAKNYTSTLICRFWAIFVHNRPNYNRISCLRKWQGVDENFWAKFGGRRAKNFGNLWSKWSMFANIPQTFPVTFLHVSRLEILFVIMQHGDITQLTRKWPCSRRLGI